MIRNVTILLAALCLSVTSPAFARSAWLEDMDLSKAAQGYGRPMIRQSITAKPLSIGGTVFEHGVGGHASFVLWIDLKRSATRFTASVGLDDAASGKGSIRFKVWLDGRKAADTGVLRGGVRPLKLGVDLRGARTLVLVVSDAGDGIAFDHSDWADAKIEYSGAAPQTVSAPVEKAIILTPQAPPSPRINGPRVYGARPGHPFLFRIPCTGVRPVRFSANGLPPGLSLNPSTGIITGSVAKPGTWNVSMRARNACGAAERSFRIVIGDTLALTPPMGWNSWYVLLDRVTDQDIRNAADAMVRTGMADYGYSYVDIDDCWAVKPGATNPGHQGVARDDQGRINGNNRFPDMPALTKYIHAKGLKAGIYTSPGPLTCAGFTASYQHEADDARRFADWGFDLLKYDWCSYGGIAPNPTLADMQKPYRQMGALLKAQPRDMLLNLCQYGMGNVSEWGRQVGGQSWRTTGDMGVASSLFGNVESIGFGQNGLEKWAGPGHWNDPDYLMIGWITWGGKLQPTPLTPNEQYTYVSLWSLLAAPLFFSGDMTRLDAFTLGLLCNNEVIDVNQDPLGRQGRRAAADDEAEVWVRDLNDGSKAVGLFNRGEVPMRVTARWKALRVSGPRVVRDLWRQKDIGTFRDAFSATVPRHGVVLVRVRPTGRR